MVSRNSRLLGAIERAGLTLSDVATKIGVDPKTVERWIRDDQTPYPKSRAALSELLNMPQWLLFPSAPLPAPRGGDEIVDVYETRAELPPSTFAALAQAATHNIDLLAYAAIWVWDTIPGFSDLLAQKSKDDVAVRLCLGDSDSDAVRQRGADEKIHDSMAARCRLSATYAAPVVTADPTAVRLHATPLYASIFRFDDDVLVNWHLFGNAAAESPVFHFRWRRDDGIAANCMRSFERVWDCAQPLSTG